MGQTATVQRGGFISKLPPELNQRILAYTNPQELYDATRTSKYARTFYNDYSRNLSNFNDTFEDAALRGDLAAMQKFYQLLEKEFEREEQPILDRYPSGPQSVMYEKEIRPIRKKYLGILEGILLSAALSDVSPTTMEALAKMYEGAVMSWGQDFEEREFSGWTGFHHIYDHWNRWAEIERSYGYPTLKALHKEIDEDESVG